MKTFVGLWISSGAFGFTIAVIYWFSSRDFAGTFLLGFMTMGFAWIAGYTYISEKETHLPGDDAEAEHAKYAGEDIGIVTKTTPWPFLLALSILTFLVGTIWSDFLLFAGLAAVLLCLWRLGAESARVGYKRVMTKEGPQDVT